MVLQIYKRNAKFLSWIKCPNFSLTMRNPESDSTTVCGYIENVERNTVRNYCLCLGRSREFSSPKSYSTSSSQLDVQFQSHQHSNSEPGLVLQMLRKGTVVDLPLPGPLPSGRNRDDITKHPAVFWPPHHRQAPQLHIPHTLLWNHWLAVFVSDIHLLPHQPQRHAINAVALPHRRDRTYHLHVQIAIDEAFPNLETIRTCHYNSHDVFLGSTYRPHCQIWNRAAHLGNAQRTQSFNHPRRAESCVR